MQDISFGVGAGERVAIVGRTGAGKSTLVLALIPGLEPGSGRIEIDGVNIASVTLSQLRRVAITVPQDPELFAGTLLNNLVPDKMLEALRPLYVADPDIVTCSDLNRAADN